MKILLVEDEILISQEIKRQLEEIGYLDTHQVSNDLDAKEKFKQVSPDLIIMDIGLVGSSIDGIVLAKHLYNIKPTPIIFLSAYSDQNTIERVKSIKYANYLIKPCSLRQLYVTIDLAINDFNNERGVAFENSPQSTLYNSSNTVFIKDKGHVYKRINTDDITYVTSVRGGVEIYTESSKYMLTASLISFEEQMARNSLIRVHRSFIVNKNKVEAIGDKELHIPYRNSIAVIPVSNTFWSSVKNEFLKLKSD